MIQTILKMTRSLFVRLVLIILCAGFLINLVVFVSFRHLQHRSPAIYHRILEHYAQTLIADIGDPPSLQRAEQISVATGFVIIYRNQGDRLWETPNRTSAALPDVERYRIRPVSERTAIGAYRGHMLIRASLKQGELFFVAPRSEAVERSLRRWMVYVLAALTAILGGAYLSIRCILRPLARMRAGMEAVHAGRLDHRLPQQGATEFRALTAAFNAMTAHVREMLHSKERLLLDVSHELRSPIARMKVALAMIPASDHSASIGEDLREMESMVNTVLASARLQHNAYTLKRDAISLQLLVCEAIAPWLDKAPGVRIETSPEVTLYLDKEKMRTVLHNLVDNAIKYSTLVSAPVTVAWQADTERLTLTVKDHGIGIPAEDLPHIFEPFFRVDDSRSRSTGGFGLGLSLAKSIVEAHGGTLQIMSTPQTGTCAEIVLPII